MLGKYIAILHCGIVHLLEDDSGTTAIEYGLIGALVSIAAVASMSGVGTTLSSVYFDRVITAFNGR